MNIQREPDLMAVGVIVAGFAVGFWFLGPINITFGKDDHRAETINRAEEVIRTERALDGVPFHASSFTSGFSAQGVYAGTMARDGDRIRVHVPEATLRRLKERPAGERLVALRLGLAVGTSDGSWSVVSQGEAHPIDRSIGEGETVLIRDMDLDVPVDGKSLCGAWLVIVHDIEYRDAKGDLQPAWTYAHSDRESFAQLVGEEAACR